MLSHRTQATNRLRLGVRAAQWPPVGASGDLVETLTHPDGSMTVLLADVCGNGAAAAPLAEAVRRKARAAMRCFRAPGALLAVLSDALLPTMPLDSFVAAVAAHIDCDGRTMRAATAGHLGPYVRRNGVVISCPGEASGPPLGIFERIEYPETTSTLVPDDLVVLATDGITDALATSADATGERGLRAHLETMRDTADTCRRLLWFTAPHTTDAMVVTIHVGLQSRKDSHARNRLVGEDSQSWCASPTG
jgi:serine phosphatase RsbU (regulator of sigma subunit)